MEGFAAAGVLLVSLKDPQAMSSSITSIIAMGNPGQLIGIALALPGPVAASGALNLVGRANRYLVLRCGILRYQDQG